jgi:hypothetical protein
MAAFRKIVVLVAALCWALIAGASVAWAQTITNTAAATWLDRGNSFTTVSNTVAIALKVQPVTVETFKLLDDGEQALTFTPAECGGEQIVFPAGSVSTSVSSLERTNQVHIGDVLFFCFTAPSANLDPAQIDTISAVLTTTAGDREAISI